MCSQGDTTTQEQGTMMAQRSSRTRLGTRLADEDKEYVLRTMKPADVDAEHFLRVNKFAVTKYGKLDRRTREPAEAAADGATGKATIADARDELSRMRELVRIVLDEMKDEQD